MSYLLDSCILSKLRRSKERPCSALLEWIGRHDESLYYISAVSIGEIQSGIARLQEGSPKRMVLEDWLHGDLIPRFDERILPVDPLSCLCWGQILASAGDDGKTLPAIDALIAAQAITHSLVIVTDNAKHFIPAGAPVINPMEVRASST